LNALVAAKKDFTQIALAVVQQATGEAPNKSRKLVATKASGKLGGKARMAQLTDEQRHELAMKGVLARKAPTSFKVGATRVTKKT
jgi:hypothetical protein